MSNDNVVLWRGITKLDLPADRVLDNAPRDLAHVVIVGEYEDGERFFASSVAGGPDVLWMLEKAKQDLLSIGEDE